MGRTTERKYMMMTPREALFHLAMALGPIPMTKRDDNLSFSEAKIQLAMTTLQKWVEDQENSLGLGVLHKTIAEPNQAPSQAEDKRYYDATL